MKIAIINQHFDFGGVETFLLSLIRQFGRLGHEVDCFLLEPHRANALMPQLQALGVRIEALSALRQSGGDRHYDVAMVTNPATLFESLRQLSDCGLRVKRFVVGVYQTRMFCLDRGPLNLHNRLTRRVFATVPTANAIFGNDACRAEHAKRLPAMASAPVIALIVDGDKFTRRPALRRSKTLRLVSIGRLEPFKTYNLSMLDVVRRLREQGHAVVWDVYGSGPLQTNMAQRVAQLGLAEHVRLCGNVAYDAIPGVLGDAFAFVGSGLSMMEAAACGVPTLPAIEYSDRAETFGFVQDIDGISFFEPNLAFPRHDIADTLCRLIRLSPEAYEAIGDAGRAKMAVFFAEAAAQRYLEVFRSCSLERPVLNAATYWAYRASAALHHRGRALLRRLGQRN
jgi:glycosyltransferase involved in cell wall biosynthesis